MGSSLFFNVFQTLTFLIWGSVGVLKASGAEPFEFSFYSFENDHRALDSIKAHKDKIAILMPMSFSVDGTGRISQKGSLIIPRAARTAGISLIPLLLNVDFDSGSAHALFSSPTAQDQMIAQMIALARAEGFVGWQLDFEDILVSDRDGYTALTQRVYKALKAAGLRFSLAVPPRLSDEPGNTPVEKYMFEHWGGAYAYAELAKNSDFLTLMSYSQHGHGTPPGPISSYDWVEEGVKYVLKAGVPPSKLSLGIPTYSYRWFSGMKEGKRQPVTQALAFENVEAILRVLHLQPQWNQMERCHSVRYTQGNTNEYLFIEDKDSFRERLQLARTYKLRGASIFRLGLEDARIWDLVDAPPAPK